MEWFSSLDLERVVKRSMGSREATWASHSSARSQSASGSILEVEDVVVNELKGGHASRVLRLDVQFSLGDGQGLTESFVQKYSRPQEREAMVLLDSIVDEHPLPRLLGSGEDEVGLWLLMPYMDGTLREEFTLPDDVIRTLAHVHSRFEDEEMLAKVLPRLNADFLVRALDRIQTVLDMKEGRSDSHCSFLHDGITRLREAPQILGTVQHLPQTLLHGDVHPGNIIECHSEGSVLFDWGNAMVGPAGVDLCQLHRLDRHSGMDPVLEHRRPTEERASRRRT